MKGKLIKRLIRAGRKEWGEKKIDFEENVRRRAEEKRGRKNEKLMEGKEVKRGERRKVASFDMINAPQSFPYINQDTQFARLAVDPCTQGRISQCVTVFVPPFFSALS